MYASYDSTMFEVTPHDTLPLIVPVNSIIVGVQGDVVVTTTAHDDVVLTDVVGQLFLPDIIRIKSTGTTASKIVAIASKALR